MGAIPSQAKDNSGSVHKRTNPPPIWVVEMLMLPLQVCQLKPPLGIALVRQLMYQEIQTPNLGELLLGQVQK